MSFLYTIAGIALVLFYIGYGTGFTRADDEEPNLRGVAAMLIGGIFSAITWGARVSIDTFVLFAAAFGALFLFGLGRFLGSLVSIFYDEGPRRRTAAFVTMGLPVALVIWLFYSSNSAETARQARNAAAREVLQAETYDVRFGAYDIQVPGAPVLSLVHPCDHSSNCCTTRFGNSIAWNKRSDAPSKLFGIDLVAYTWLLDAQAEWCARRTDISADSIWCNLTEEDDMRFKPAYDLRGSEAVREARCNAHSIGWIGCAVTHDVAPGVAVRLGSIAEDEMTARTLLREKRDRADAIWASFAPLPR